jgi:superfamily II DNA or RNA helicase
MTDIILRDYQETAVHDLRTAYAQGAKAPILVMATGAGKTYTFCYICLSAIRKGGRVLILVHKDDLIRQCSKSLANLGIAHGIISPNFTPDYFAPVQIASVFSLKADMPLEAFSLVIIDEAHHGTASSWRTALGLFPNAKILGVTATPRRTDGQGLGVESGGVFDALVQGPQLRELIDRNVLCDYEYYAPAVGLDSGQRVGDALKYWEQICPGVPTVGFCVNVEDAKRLADTFKAAGYRAAHLDGTMKTDHRQGLLDSLAAGELDLVASCRTITEGTDVPEMTCAMLMTYSKSVSYFMQITGRCFRKAESKDKAYILDCVNLVGTHGLPCDDREWSLAGGGESKSIATERTKTIRTCERCFRPFYMSASRKCVHCGHEQSLNAKEIKEIEAELIKVEREEQRKKEEAERWHKTKERAKADSYEALLEVERSRKYKPGWAKMVYQARQKKKAAEGKGKLFGL